MSPKLALPEFDGRLFAVAAIAVVAVLAVALVFLSKASTAQEVPPPVYGIEIYEYDRTIQQAAGTTAVYAVKVRNTGVLELAGVRLSADRLPSVLFQPTTLGAKPLKFGETAELNYKLTVPEGFDGTYAFSLVASASYGVGNVSHAKPVQLIVEATSCKVATTATTSGSVTQKPGEVDVNVILPFIIGSVTERPLAGALPSKSFSDLAELFFSKFRSCVEYVRTTASSIVSDTAMLRTTAAALFVIVLFLIVIQKALVKAVR